jgi:hypothetical protein
MTSDEVNMWRLACVLVFIMALSALVVGSLAFTRSNNGNNPNNIFLGSTSLTDFAATQTLKTRNIIGSTLAPAITTAGTLFNGDLNANSVSFTGQGITLYSDTTQLYFVLDSAPDSKQFLSTSTESFNLSGVVTSSGLVTTIPDGNIVNSMLANVALSNISGSAGVTDVTGTLTSGGTLTASGALSVLGIAAFQSFVQFVGLVSFSSNIIANGTLNVAGATTAAAVSATSLTVSGLTTLSGGLNLPNTYANSATLVSGTTSVALPSVLSGTIVLLTSARPAGTAALGTLSVTITPTVGFTINSLNTAGAVTTDAFSVFYTVIF